LYLKLLFNSFGFGHELTLALNFLPSKIHLPKDKQPQLRVRIEIVGLL